MTVLLFPSQLFSVDTLTQVVPGEKDIAFIEHPLFYGRRRGSGAVASLKLNQVRLVYMYVTHRRYLAYLKTHGFRVTFIAYTTGTLELKKAVRVAKGSEGSEIAQVTYIDPCDLLLEAEIQQVFPTAVRKDSPSFLLTRAQLDGYMASKPNPNLKLQHGDFYTAVKTLRSDIPVLKALINVKNLDTQNRAPYRAGMPMPPSPFKKPWSAAGEWKEAVAWLGANGFKNNPGPLMAWDEWIRTYAVYLPAETEHVRVWLKDFFKERFQNYGTYQDVVVFENPLLFHSGASIYLNNGLITPDEVLRMAGANRARVSPATLEGFVRQLAGWREYARLYYYRVPPKAYKKNVFGLGAPRAALGREWYRGTVGIEPVDKTIQWAMNYGYINHIQRLMIVSNFMTLWEHTPDQLYKWMYEFSLDSYEWVMVFNCYSMGSWGDGGVAMRKPYISKANYIVQMSNASRGQKGADWIEPWNQHYTSFMRNHQDVLKHTQAWRPAELGK